MLESDSIRIQHLNRPATICVMRNNGECWGRIRMLDGEREEFDVSAPEDDDHDGGDLYEWNDVDAREAFIEAAKDPSNVSPAVGWLELASAEAAEEPEPSIGERIARHARERDTEIVPIDAALSSLGDEARAQLRWAAIAELKDREAADAANGCSDDPSEQEEAMAAAEQAVTDQVSDSVSLAALLHYLHDARAVRWIDEQSNRRSSTQAPRG